MPKKICQCGNNRENNHSCERCSTYKMVFLLKDPKSHLKKRNSSGELVNPVRWSFLKEDKRGYQVVKKNMLQRAKKMVEYSHSRYIAFYSRNSGHIENIAV